MSRFSTRLSSIEDIVTFIQSKRAHRGMEEGGDDAAVPGELSPAQIRAVLARTACDPSPTYVDDGSGVKYPTSVVQLRRLAGGALAKNESSFT